MLHGYRNGFRLTTSRVEPPSASLTLEMLGFLMIDEDFQVIEVPFAIVAPRTGQDLVEVRMLSLCLDHCRDSAVEGIAVGRSVSMRRQNIEAGEMM